MSGRRGQPAQQTNRPRAAVNRLAPTQAAQPNQPTDPAPLPLPPAVATDSNNPNEAGIGFKNLIAFFLSLEPVC